MQKNAVHFQRPIIQPVQQSMDSSSIELLEYAEHLFSPFQLVIFERYERKTVALKALCHERNGIIRVIARESH